MDEHVAARVYITLTTVKYAEEITEELNHTYFLQIRVKIQISSFMDGRFVLAAAYLITAILSRRKNQ